MTHLVLIGLMGVGKTTVGRRVAALLDRPFVDSDLHIEATTGRTVRQIAAEDGAAAMRAVESAALADALARPTPSVIGCRASTTHAMKCCASTLSASRTAICGAHMSPVR